MPLERDKPNGFKLALRDELKTGVYRQLFSHAVPLWSDGENIQFTSLGVQKRPGCDRIIDLGNSEPIRGLLQQSESTDRIIYAGDLTTLYRVDADAGTSTTVGSGYSLAEDGGGSVWDSGSTTWDSGTTLWDDGLVQADHWSMVDYGSFVFATSGSDAPQIRKVRDFVDMPGGVTGATVTSGGTGYVAGDTLTLTGGDGSGATAEVVTVNSGAITSVTITDSGTGYTTAPTGFTGGTGSGATLSFTVCDMDVTTVQIFVNRGPHILGFNTSNSDSEFIWCDADDPDTWQSTASNLAGALEIRELNGPIKAAVPLGNRIAVYGEDQMFLVSYLGNQLVFGYQPALNGIGAVSKRAVVPVGNKNYGLHQQGFFVTDGASFEYIGDPAMRDWYQDNAAIGQISKAVAYHDEENGQIAWYFPTTSVSNSEGLTFNYRLGTWAPITGAVSAAIERVILSGPVTGSESGVLFLENVGNDNFTSALTAWVRTKALDLGNADMVKELDSIRIGYEGAGLQYRIGWSETETGTITWGAYSDVSAGFGFDNLRTAGRWLHLELYSADLGDSWEVMSVEVIGRVEGTR